MFILVTLKQLSKLFNESDDKILEQLLSSYREILFLQLLLAEWETEGTNLV